MKFSLTKTTNIRKRSEEIRALCSEIIAAGTTDK